MFWATVSEGRRLKAWKTKPIRSRRRTVSLRSLSFARLVSPSTTVPDVGRSSPAAMLRKVLFPEPEGPMIAVNEPRGSVTLTPSRATTAASPLPWTLRTSRRATAGAGAGVSGEGGGGWLGRVGSGLEHGMHFHARAAPLPTGLPASSTPAAGAARGGQPYRAR